MNMNISPSLPVADLSLSELKQSRQPRHLSGIGRRGPVEVDTLLTEEEACEICRQLLKEDEFAQKLAHSRSPSTVQFIWMHIKAMKHLEEKEAKDSGQLPTAQIDLGGPGKFAELIRLYESAQKGSTAKKPKPPKLRFQTDNYDRVYIRLLGEKSRYHGLIGITANGLWCGRLEADGIFHKSDRCPDEIIELLQTFAENPLATIEANGKEFGFCSCCGLELTNPESIERGIGPICLNKWGLG